MKRPLLIVILLLSGSIWLAGCNRTAPPPLLDSAPPVDAAPLPTAAASATAAPPAAPPSTPSSPTPAPTALPTPTTLPLERAESPCGVLLPLTTADTPPAITAFEPRPVDLEIVRARIPAAARTAFEHLLDNPQDVALVAFQAGRENEGIALNGEMSMPLASVDKWLHLLAYVEASAAGELNGQTRVALADLDRFYLFGSDLRAHQRAISALRDEGRVAADETISLEEVAAIMMHFSSNAAADYLHLLLGQRRLEQAALDFGLTAQTAPCPFLGQFLAMSHHGRAGSDQAALAAYQADPAAYGREVMDLTETFVRSAEFRAAEGRWRAPVSVQREFVATLSPRGSAADYGRLLARLAQNGLGSPESSFLARRLAEWPMRFGTNQALFDNLAYKDGRLPGVLTLTYYAYRPGDPAPVIVVLFFRNLPQPTYNDFRRSLTNDEFARWLLIDPAAIGLLKRVLPLN